MTEWRGGYVGLSPEVPLTRLRGRHIILVVGSLLPRRCHRSPIQPGTHSADSENTYGDKREEYKNEAILAHGRYAAKLESSLREQQYLGIEELPRDGIFVEHAT